MEDGGFLGRKSKKPNAGTSGKETVEVKGREPYNPENSDLTYPITQQVTCLPPKPYKKSMVAFLAQTRGQYKVTNLWTISRNGEVGGSGHS